MITPIMSWSAIITLLFSALICISQVQDLWGLSAGTDQRVRVYTAVGKWLDANVPPDATVATLEVGIIGYYSHRRVIDFGGLIQPDIARFLNRDTTYEDSAFMALHRYRPNYLVLQDGVFSRLEWEYSLIYCFPAQTFVGEQYGYSSNMRVYHCEWNQ